MSPETPSFSDAFIHAQVRKHPAGSNISFHTHEYGQLSIVLQGTMTVTSEYGWWLTPPGLGVWIPPDVVHGSIHSETSSFIRLQFSPAIIKALPADCCLITVSDLMREMACETIRAVEQREQAEYVNLLAQLMIHQIMRPSSVPGLFVPHGRDRRLRQVINMLRNTPGSTTTLDEFAPLVHASPRTLARLFVSETGMPFGQWREHLRVVCAVDHLAQGRSIAATAFELGYQSASSFTALFTRVLGLPPRRYMKTMHGYHVKKEPD